MSLIKQLSVGERVAFYRRRRGMTQVLLADRVGRTASWIEKIESGRAPLDRISVLRAVADALEIPVSTLLADENPAEQKPLATRSASLSYAAVNPRVATEVRALQPSQILALTDQIWAAYQDGRFGFATAKLNSVLPAAFAAAQEQSGDRAAFRNLAHLYHAAASILTKQGDLTTARVCAERGDDMAQRTDDQATRLSLHRSIAHTLLAQAQLDTCVQVVRDGVISAGQPSDPLSASVTGALLLVGAVASARAGERREAATFLRHAEALAGQVGDGHNLAWTAFGQSNVELHRVTVAAELGDFHLVVQGAAIGTSALPHERRTRHHLELARGFYELGGLDDATAHLREAHRLAPELFRHHFIARSVLGRWMRSKTRPSPELVALAREIGHSA